MKRIVISCFLIMALCAGGIALAQTGYLQPRVTAAYSSIIAALGFTPAHSGANSDITSLSGLSTPLSVSQGGTGQTTAYAALYALGGQPNGAVQNILASAPSSPVDGAIYVADGVNWNPASRVQTTKTASTIAFVSGTPATITDSGAGFVTAGFSPAQWLLAYDNTSATIIGTFEIAQVSAGTITLKTGQTVTSQSAGHSITLTARTPYFVIYSLYGNAGSAEYVGMGNIVGTTYFPELTANRAVYGDSSSVLQSSATTNIELGYINGVTSGIQSQLNAKAPLASPAFTDIPSNPATKNGYPWEAVVCQSAVPQLIFNQTGWASNPTAATTLASCVIPAGAMGLNGSIQIDSYWSMYNLTNNKTLTEAFGGSNLLNITYTADYTLNDAVRILANRNSASSQIINVYPGAAATGNATNYYNPTPFTIATGSQQTLMFQGTTTVEPAMTVTSVNCNGTVCTVNTSAGAYISGDYTQITSCSPSNINGTVVGPISGGTGQGYFSFASSYSGSPTGCTVQRWSKIQLEWFRVKLSPGAN